MSLNPDLREDSGKGASTIKFEVRVKQGKAIETYKKSYEVAMLAATCVASENAI